MVHNDISDKIFLFQKHGHVFKSLLNLALFLGEDTLLNAVINLFFEKVTGTGPKSF